MANGLEPVPGYEWKNYDKKKGINPSGEDIPSNLLVEQVAGLILDGYAHSTIKNMLYITYGMNSYSVSFIIHKAEKHIQDTTVKQTDNMLNKQNSRLFSLYRKACDANDTKNALAVLKEINELNNLKKQKIEVTNTEYVIDLFGKNGGNKEDK